MEPDQLIEKMLDAYYGEDSNWRTNKLLDSRAHMAAALDVVLGEVLGEPTRDEWGDAAYNGPSDYHRNLDGKCYLDCATVAKMLSSRRARWAKVKMPEERVSVFPSTGGAPNWHVVVDKNRDHPDTAYNISSEKVARGYAASLIAQLKAGN